MQLVHVIILGIVEGITEFLPISSTAHLILTSTLLKLPQSESVALFEVVIQFGAILAVIALFWKTVLHNHEFFLKACVAFVPTALVGFFMHDIIKNVFFESTTLIAGSLIVVGCLFLLVEWYITKGLLKSTRELSSLSYKEALIIGLIQACAIVPGVSRAGAVIVGMMLFKFKRSDSALFSFLLAVPTIGAAAVFDLVKTDPSLLTSAFIQQLVVGSVVACIAAFVVVKWLISFLQKHSLTPFAYYRIALGIAVLFAQYI